MFKINLIKMKLKKPKKIYLHGLFGSPGDFDEIAKKSDVVFNLEDFATYPLSFDQIGKKIKEKILEPVDLIGYSLGGRIALHLKASYPNLIRRCVILSAKAHLEPEKWIERVLFQIRWELLFSTLSLTQFFEAWYAQPLFEGLNGKDHLEKRLSITVSKHQILMNQLSLLHQSPSLSKLIKSKNSILFLYGNRDSAYKEYFLKLEKLGFQTKEIPHSSHALLLQNKPAVKSAIKKFLS